MDITTNCPACGATLSIADDADHINCPYCGAKYNLDLSDVQPIFTPVTPQEMTTDPLPVQSAQTESAEPSWVPTPPAYQAPQPAAEPPQPWQPPATPPPTVRPPNKNRPIWIVIAIAVALLICGLCACMALSFLVIQRSGQIPIWLP